MQLYAVGAGIDERQISEAVLHAAESFPQLSESDVFSMSSGGCELAVAAISHPERLAGPRRYRHVRGQQLVLFDGRPVDGRLGEPVDDAAVLLEMWGRAVPDLTGLFSATRVNLHTCSVECVLDPLGLSQVFVYRNGSSWLLSNSVRAIRRAIGSEALDPIGVSSFLTMGWAISGHTYFRGITKLTGGLTSDPHRDARTETDSLPVELLTQIAQAPRVDLVSEALVRATAAVGRGVPVRCGVTAGRDSRVLVALARAAGLDPDYYTVGEAGDPDVEIGRQVAHAAHGRHHSFAPKLPVEASEWHQKTESFIDQTDGLASLSSIADWLDSQRHAGTVGIKLWGVGGEIGRAAIGLGTALASNVPGLRSSVTAQRKVLLRKVDSGLLVKPEAAAATAGALEDFFSERRAEGWSTASLLEAYYTFVRVRHWAAPGLRRASATTDLYSPFATREFLRYAFGHSSRQRYLETGHYDLLRELGTGVPEVPFARPWRPQRPKLAPLLLTWEAVQVAEKRARSRTGTGGSRTAPAQFGHDWLEGRISLFRDILLSHSSSDVWDYVDRGRVEAVLEATSPLRRPHLEHLCRLATVLFATRAAGKGL